MNRLLLLLLLLGLSTPSLAQRRGGPKPPSMRLEPAYYFQGLKLRADFVGAAGIARDLRDRPFDLVPGFGFDVQLGVGISRLWSVYAGYVTVSHNNTDRTGRDPDETYGYNGFRFSGAYRLRDRSRLQPYAVLGLGRYELINAEGDGRVGWGIDLGGGAERWLTNRWSIGGELSYRLVTFPQEVRNGRGLSLDPNTRGDVIVLRVHLTRTLPRQSG